MSLTISKPTLDARLFEKWYQEYYERLVHYATSILKDVDIAEGQVQDMFVNLWEKRDSIEIDRSEFSYLMRSVHNRCLNQIKHQKVKYQHAEESRYLGHDTFEDSFESFELEERIQEAIDELPEKTREVFEYSRFKGMKYQEIADKQGTSVKTVENQMGKALKHLRLKLGDYLRAIILLGINLFIE